MIRWTFWILAERHNRDSRFTLHDWLSFMFGSTADDDITIVNRSESTVVSHDCATFLVMSHEPLAWRLKPVRDNMPSRVCWHGPWLDCNIRD